jgi:CRISPR-associated protein Csy2
MTVSEPSALLILPRLRVQNANAISSPLTWGVPAPTAFTGFVHALSRNLASQLDLELDGVAIVCHRFEPQVSRPAGRRAFTFNLTRNPLDKDGSTAAIVEEGRAHIDDISLVIGVRGAALYSGLDRKSIADDAWREAMKMRIAGGSILPPTRTCDGRYRGPELIEWLDTPEQQHAITRKISRSLLPGFALVSREAKLEQHLEWLRQSCPDSTSLDALLDLSRLNFDPPSENEREWSIRPKSGWLVPLPVGYAAISPLYAPGEVKSARDQTVPFRFVESVLSLGEWISPHRVENICDLLWYHESDLERGIYRCTTPAYSAQLS